MTKKYLRKLPCELCGSSDGKQEIEEDGVIHYHCFVCGEHQEEKKESRAKKGVDLPFGALKSRGIPQYIAEEYGVRIEYSETTGEEVAYWFPRTKGGVVTGYQVRRLPKDFKAVGDTKNCELFGQVQAGQSGKFIIVTEGNEDCLAAKYMLMQAGKNYRAVSLPSGANIKAVKDNLEWLEKFDTIVLALDQDGPGKKLAKEIAGLLSPGKVKIASFSEKDANKMLDEGKGKEFYRAILNAKEEKPDGIVSIEEIYEEATKPIERGLAWPWPTLTRVTYGRRRKEIYGFGAGTGAGKTEAFKEVIQHIIINDNLPVGLFFLEEHPALTAKVIAGKLNNKMFHIPDAGWTEEELSDGINSLRDKVYLYNHFGQKDWQTIKSKIRYMVVSLGIKDIFLDHLTAIVAEANDVNKELERVMADMAALSQELDFTLYYISHLTRPHQGPSHEEGGRVTSAQFRGSGAIGFWTHYLFGFERNQQAEGEVERNTVLFRVLKDRYTGQATGITFPLYYNNKTGRFLEDIISEF